MTGFREIKLSDNFQFELLEKPTDFEITPNIEEQVELIWQKEKRKLGDKLYNGLIFHLIEANAEKIRGALVEYRYFLAQVMVPSLRKYLPICPIGVCSLTMRDDKILIGKRSHTVTEYRGYLEGVPSGTLDTGIKSDGNSCLRQMLINELDEEAGIKADTIVSFGPFHLVIEKEGAGFCTKLQLKHGTEGLDKTSEYDEIYWTPIEKLKERIARNPKEYVPLTLYMLKLYGFI